MGQKVHPTGLRVGVIKPWESRWYAKPKVFGDTLVEDFKLRTFLLKTLASAGVPKVEIERNAKRVYIRIHCAKPGAIIGRQGAEIDKLRTTCEKKLGGQKVSLDIVEIKQPDLNAQLVAENIAQQLEKRVGFRRALKLAMGRTMRLGARGIKVQVSGRLGGAEIANTQQYHDGTVPLQTIRADIDYGFFEAKTTYGRLGVKVWLYKGEILHEGRHRRDDTAQPRRDDRQRRDRRPNDRPRRDNVQRDARDRQGGAR